MREISSACVSEVRKNNGATREWSRGPVPIQQPRQDLPRLQGGGADLEGESAKVTSAVAKNMHALSGGFEIQQEGRGQRATNPDYGCGRSMRSKTKFVQFPSDGTGGVVELHGSGFAN